MGPVGRHGSGSPCWLPAGEAAAQHHRTLLTAVLLLAVLLLPLPADGQTVQWETGFPKLDVTYDWSLKATVGGSGTDRQVIRGETAEIQYTIAVERKLTSIVGTLSFRIDCGTNAVQGVTVTTGSAVPVATGNTDNNGVASFQNVPWPTAQTATAQIITNTQSEAGISRGSINVECAGPPVLNQDFAFTFITREIRDSAVLTDVITWPSWESYFPQGGWLTARPATAVTRGRHPGGGIPLKGSETFEYTWVVRDIVLCFDRALVSSTATLVAGVGNDQLKWTDTTAVTLSVIGCNVQPSIIMDQPNLQTSLVFQWSQSLTALSSAAVRVPWGGGGDVQAQAVFTRAVTSATFLASFTLTVANPSTAPIALSNLQLACPWGGNTLLPCGAVASGGIGGMGGGLGANQWLVIPGSGSVQCNVNNLQIAATWGNDFSQPCTILTSNWLGTQTTLTGVVLDFSAPTRWQLINNCATWTVTCSQPAGNPLYLPAIGGLPSGRQVCGNDQSNQPLPPQPFSISLSGGWIGDGMAEPDIVEEPALVMSATGQLQQNPNVMPTRAPYNPSRDPCAASVSTTCTSQLQLQSTQGTTQNFGGVQSNTISVQATPTDCPRRPPRAPPVVIPEPVLPVAPSGFMSTTPVITTAVTKTYIKGTFTWSVKTQLNPANQAVAQGSSGILGSYTVVAAPEPVPGSDPQYQLQGMVTVQNPAGNTVPMQVQQVNVVVDTAQVALVCPGLPGTLAPGQVAQCGFMVNYNKGPAPNAVFGRVTDATGRSVGDGSPVLFSFDTADASGARGACARVYQTFATNWFDLVQVTGVAPSFTGDEPTTVCSPATWRFDVRFTPRELAPCGVQQVVQTVTASYTSEAAAQDSSTASLYVTGASCDPPPADFLPATSGSTPTPTSNTAPGPTSPPSSSSSSGGGGGSTGAGGAASIGSSSSESEPLPAGVSVVVSDVQQQRSASPAWELVMEPADNVTVTPGKSATVGFKLRWSKTKPSTDYTGTVTVINNAPNPAELDGVYVNLIDSMGTGDATDEAMPECPVDSSGALQPITGSNPFTLAAFGRISCKFTLRSVHSGALVGTATPADGGDGIVSGQVAVTSLMADSSCSRMVSGMAASELGTGGVLFGGNGTSEEEDVCSASSKVVKINIPADADTSKACSFPVVALAWIKPDAELLGPGTVAFAKSDVKIAGCREPASGQATADLAGVSITKGRALRWVVSIETDPPVSANETFEEENLGVTTTWRQASELRLNVSGEVAIKGSGSVTKAKVLAIPLCSPSAGPDCKPVTLEVNCKTAPTSRDASRCVFNFTRVLPLPGLLLTTADQVQPAAAQPYDLARARYGGRPVPQCAVLTEARSLEPLDGAPAAEVAVAGATAVSSEPFCGLEQSRNYTLSFSSVECGNLYAFATSAAAKPVIPGLPEASADLAFDVTC